jgi:hypothetical protein
VLKRHGVDEGESEFGADFSFSCLAKDLEKLILSLEGGTGKTLELPQGNWR